MSGRIVTDGDICRTIGIAPATLRKLLADTPPDQPPPRVNIGTPERPIYSWRPGSTGGQLWAWVKSVERARGRAFETEQRRVNEAAFRLPPISPRAADLLQGAKPLAPNALDDSPEEMVRALRRARQEVAGHVYFITTWRAAKVGTTLRPVDRGRSYMLHGGEIEVLAVTGYGGRLLENTAHAALAEWQIDSEWFAVGAVDALAGQWRAAFPHAFDDFARQDMQNASRWP